MVKQKTASKLNYANMFDSNMAPKTKKLIAERMWTVWWHFETSWTECKSLFTENKNERNY